MFRRFIFLLFLLSLTVQACGQPTAVVSPVVPLTPEATTGSAPPASTSLPPPPSPTQIDVALPGGEQTAAPTDTAVPTPTARPTSEPTDLSITATDVYLYPVPVLYEGDLVTFQLLAHVPPEITPEEVTVNVWVDDERIVDATLNWRTLGGHVMGLYEWVWDTSQAAGDYEVSIVLDPADEIQVGDENPDNNRVDMTVTVNPASLMPPNEAEATWLLSETDCCLVYAVSGTAAGRDLAQLSNMVSVAMTEAGAQLGVAPDNQYEFYFVDRVIGQGGYAGSAVVISYLDRDYAGGGLYEVLVHESVHLLDRQLAPNRITFLAEGVAIWTTGGHYKPESLPTRAAALLEMGRFVPLAELIDNFYPTQHEIGYLEAGAFVHYLVEQYGWERVRSFYADVSAEGDTPLSQVVDAALQRHFGRTLADVERDWLAGLALETVKRADIADLETTIRFYQVMRHYQQEYDPTAYFLRAWLPTPQEARARELTADFTRRPTSQLHVTLEAMLQAADAALRNGEYNRTHVLLDSVERVLNNNGVFLDPLSNSYYSVVETTSALGYEPQQIDLKGSRASVVASYPGTNRLTNLNLVLNNQHWLLSD